MRRVFSCIAVVMAAASAASAQQPEALSLLRKPLYAPHPKGDARERIEAELADARAALAKDPSSVDAVLRLGSAQAASGHLLDAIETYTLAIEQHPDAGRLFLSRGRLLLTIRKFDIAIRDFRRAKETIPDAQCPLAFAEYVNADYVDAAEAFKGCPQSPFAPAAAARTGAPLKPPPSDDALLNAYYAALTPLLQKDVAHAREQLEHIIAKQDDHWMEDAYIAAESDLARLPKRKKKR